MQSMVVIDTVFCRVTRCAGRKYGSISAMGYERRMENFRITDEDNVGEGK